MYKERALAVACSKWTHNICKTCWDVNFPERKAVTLTIKVTEICCYCGCFNTTGIFVREDPTKLKCKGYHSE